MQFKAIVNKKKPNRLTNKKTMYTDLDNRLKCSRDGKNNIIYIKF